MNDYISRKDVIAALSGLFQDIIDNHQIGNGKNDYKDGIFHGEKACVIEATLRVKKLPAEDVKPVVRGTWIIHNELVKNELLDENEVYVCSACREQKTKRKYNFCPNCGADMRGEKGNDKENL